MERMNVLEKILKEIEEATYQEDAPIYLGDMEVDGYVRESKVKEIIRSHMAEKENVTSAEMIRTFVDGEPYYAIKYKGIYKDDYTIGYASYNLSYVIKWLNECFEFCGKAKVVSSNDWIPVEERMPEEGQEVLAQFVVRVVHTNNKIDEAVYIHVLYYENGVWKSFAGVPNGKVVAWQPLPEPYRAADKPDWKENMLNTFLAGH